MPFMHFFSFIWFDFIFIFIYFIFVYLCMYFLFSGTVAQLEHNNQINATPEPQVEPAVQCSDIVIPYLPLPFL